MRVQWEPDELIGSWTLVEGDWKLVRNKSGATRLGFALLLKFYELEGRFPEGPQELPSAAIDYVASLVKVDAALFSKYPWTGRTIEYHRQQVRAAFGTRPASKDDEERWAQWLADEICPTETVRERLAEALRRRCRSEDIERTTPGQVERVVGSALRRFEDVNRAGIDGGSIGWKGWSSCQVDLVLRTPPSAGIRQS